ncbi:holo-ACP synthase [Mucilaginibacter glaciei]|uniref:Holo-[acyl-carrier-protein] synthase n=1 Tax=Mucilaginibacter glaciei TaxID=2772109 RepID=A0A926NTW0_9SPHI|nr:holo-ACP synthase [Mucilaginibacter glaciei]MBD1391669.1 holo-ACP synthase [Mucilaginibacter glaciei]
MVVGVGIDLVDVERIANRISKTNGFRELVFSADEITYCEAQKNKFEHYAARFAAKEAFFKAMGTGWAAGTLFNEVGVIHNELGKPMFSFIGDTAKTISDMQLGTILLSLTHIKTVASAVVIIENNGNF